MRRATTRADPSQRATTDRERLGAGDLGEGVVNIWGRVKWDVIQGSESEAGLGFGVSVQWGTSWSAPISIIAVEARWVISRTNAAARGSVRSRAMTWTG